MCTYSIYLHVIFYRLLKLLYFHTIYCSLQQLHALDTCTLKFKLIRCNTVTCVYNVEALLSHTIINYQ